MNTKKKLILPILSLASFLAIGVGTTYALFTSNAETNISVKAGKVNVSTAIDGDTFKTYSAEGELKGIPAEDEDLIVETTTAGVFANGGTATYDNDTGEVELENLTPGDRVSFDLVAKNYSSVIIRYRPYFEVVSGQYDLLPGLTVKINDTIYSENAQLAPWAVAGIPTEEGEIINTYSVLIDFPSNKGNNYQEKSCSLRFKIEAIQGNAHVDNEPDDNFNFFNHYWIPYEDENLEIYNLRFSSHTTIFIANGDYTPTDDDITWDAPLGVKAYLNLAEQALRFVTEEEKIILTDEYRITFGDRCIPYDETLYARQGAELFGIEYYPGFDPGAYLYEHWDELDDPDQYDYDLQNISFTLYFDHLADFYVDDKILGIDVLDVSNVTDFSYMFGSRSGAVESFGDAAGEIDLSSWDTSNAINMEGMFRCACDRTYKISNFDTSKVVNMKFMFELFNSCCSSPLTVDPRREIDVSSFDTSKVVFMEGMFCYAGADKIYASDKFVTKNVDATLLEEGIFFDCLALVGGKGTAYDENHIGVEYAHLDGGTNNPGYFTEKIA